MTPDVLRQQMGSCQDESGYWARFVYASLPLKKCKFPDNEIKFDIYPLLCGLYENIESLPAYQYYLCSEGSKIYQQFFDEMEELKLNEPNQALRAVYSKFKRVAGEIALLLQSLHKAFYHNVDDDNVLEPKFMAMGVELAKRYINEIKNIYLKHEGSNEQNLSPIYSKIISLSQRKGWLKARDLKQCDRYFRNLLSIDIRRHFQDLINLGFGEVRGIGKHLEWRFTGTQNSELRTQNLENSEKQNLNPMSSNNVDNKISELPSYFLNGESYSYSYIEPLINDKVVNVDSLPNLELKTEPNSELRTQNSELIRKNLELTTNLSELKTENLELTTNLSELKINFSELRNQNLELISELKTQNELLKTQNLELRNSVNTIISQINSRSDSSQSQSPIIEEIKSKVNTSEIENLNKNSEASNLNTPSKSERQELLHRALYPLPSNEYESLSTFEPVSISEQTDILSSVNSPKNDELSIEKVNSLNELPLNKYEGLYAVVPTYYVKSGILVGLSENNGYLFGHESGMTKTIKVPLSHVIEYKQEELR
jgi:CRISPR-associated protein Cmr3